MSLEMQSIEFEGCDNCINDNDELTPILDEALARTAWVILTYHSIGQRHWGWYDWDEFRKDVQSIAARDFWTASMNDITLYVRERENAVITVEPVEGSAGTESIEITLSDGLDNVRFNQPLTILFDQPTDWVGRPFTVSQNGVKSWLNSSSTRRPPRFHSSQTSGPTCFARALSRAAAPMPHRLGGGVSP